MGAADPRGLPALTVLVGPQLDPMADDARSDLRRLEVAVRAGSRSTFDLRFAVGHRHRSAWDGLLAGGAFDPGTRVVVLTGRDDMPVLFDGIVTGQELSTIGEGDATVVLSGEDLTVLMDLDRVVAEHPGEPAHVRAGVIIAKYAAHGIVPDVDPAPILDVPTPAERIPTQADTDYRYVRRLAEDVGYLLDLRPGPTPGGSVASWGPRDRGGTPQPPIDVRSEAVSEARFRFDGLAREAVTATILDPITRTLIPIPTPDVRVVRPQLAARPAATLRHRALAGAAKLSAVEAAAASLGATARSSDAVTAEGTLDVNRYGQPLRAGERVEIQGVGAAYGGTYWVAEVTHRIEASGYEQRFVARRDGLGET